MFLPKNRSEGYADMNQLDISINDIYSAAEVLRHVARETELIPAPDIPSNVELYLKAENLQKTGSFKLRGAYYKISQLSPEELSRGIVTCSAGNHAQGVAYAARAHRAQALIFIPRSAPEVKQKAIQALGAETILVDGEFDEVQAECMRYVETHNVTYIPPFNDCDIIAGQGTIGLEILTQLPSVEAVVVPVGGGGLISGIAVAIKKLHPHCQVFGVQSKSAMGALAAFSFGTIVPVRTKKTIADGIAVRLPGEIPMKICEHLVDDFVYVSEAQIERAIFSILSQCHLLVEGAGAVAVAAVMADILPIAGKKTVSILSGGNIDPVLISQIILNTPLHY